MEFKIKEPYFTMIKIGEKRVEGRWDKPKENSDVGRYSEWNWEKGEEVKILLNPGFKESFMKKIIDVKRYRSFREMIENEGVERVVPGMDIDEGVDMYLKIPGYKDGEEKGVYAIIFE